MNTTLFSFATTDTAGPSAEVSVPTRKSTFSFRISSRATRTASSALPFVSRGRSSSLRPRTPPLALISSTYICAPFRAGSPNSAPGPDRIIGNPTLIGFWAWAFQGSANSATANRVSTRSMSSLLWCEAVIGIRVRPIRRSRRPPGDDHADPVDRARRSDVQTAPIGVAEGHVRRVLGDADHAEAGRGRVEDVDPARAAAIQVARRVDLHAVGRTGALATGLGPDAAPGESAARGEVEHADVLALGVVDEQPPPVERKAQPVRLPEVLREQRRRACVRADAVQPAKIELRIPLDAVVLHAPVARIGEVDRAVRGAHDVVRAVQLPALVVRGDRRDAPVALGARDLARGVLAREEPAFSVPREAVRHVAGLAERADAVLRRPAAQVVPGHVAPEQVAFAAVPQRPLGELAAGGDALEVDCRPDDCGEPGVASLQRHFFIRSPCFPPTYHSGGSTSSTTTQTASFGSLVTSLIASVTRFAISSRRGLSQPS